MQVFLCEQVQKHRCATLCLKHYNIEEVLHGVGADGVGVKFPIFAVNCGCLPLSFRRKRGKRVRITGEKCVEKGKKHAQKKEENHSDPIHTNPIKNLSRQNEMRACKTKIGQKKIPGMVSIQNEIGTRYEFA